MGTYKTVKPRKAYRFASIERRKTNSRSREFSPEVRDDLRKGKRLPREMMMMMMMMEGKWTSAAAVPAYFLAPEMTFRTLERRRAFVEGRRMFLSGRECCRFRPSWDERGREENFADFICARLTC